jgi:hypothetical protein
MRVFIAAVGSVCCTRLRIFGMRVVPPTMPISSISSNVKSKSLSKRSLGGIDRSIVESLYSLAVFLGCERQGCRYYTNAESKKCREAVSRAGCLVAVKGIQRAHSSQGLDIWIGQFSAAHRGYETMMVYTAGQSLGRNNSQILCP